MVRRSTKWDGSREIALGSPEYHAIRELYQEVMRSRAEWRKECIDRLVEDAILFRAEQDRDDGFHRARLSKREHYLLDAAEELHKAMHPGPVTMTDIEWAKRLRALGDNQNNSPNQSDGEAPARK
jgi:hypothetical protein